MITVVDYGVGNLGSIANLCRYLNIPARFCSSPAEVASADKLLLPGVGAFDAAMAQIEQRGLRAALEHSVRNRGVPILGICLGMQLLSEASEEGSIAGLGFIRGHTVRIPAAPDGQPRLTIPHMGWNKVSPSPSSRLLARLPPEPRFYFVHSYHVVCTDPTDTAGTVQYGAALTAAIERGNVFGTQFHPEKSHRYGMQVMRNFHSL
jgi:glutamine amidotransferase